MKKLVLPIFAISALIAPLIQAPLAHANNCNAAISRAVAETGGKLISVSTKQGGDGTVCVITLSIKDNSNKPPRLVTREVKQ